MPDPARLLTTLRQAARHWQNTPGRAGRIVNLHDAREVIVCGDLHGNVENFRLLLKRADLATHRQRHVVLQEVVHGPFRYPSGGDKSHQLLDLTAALTCQFPGRVHFLLGNHELAQWQAQRIGKADEDYNEMFRKGVEAAYGERAGEVYEAYLELFAAAALIVRTPNRVCLSHSLPAARHLETFTRADWERPDLRPEDTRLGGCIHALLWGRDNSPPTVMAFLAKMDGDLLITGHIPCDTGYAVPNERQLILDAVNTPACVCLFATDRPLTQQDLLAGVGTL
jgi:Calcineurin-like phosphoesterase